MKRYQSPSNLLTRREALRQGAAASVAIVSAGVPAIAQERFPSRPVRIVVPFAPGGAGDVVTRLIASRLTTRMGQPVITENRVGAGGSVGLTSVTKSPADGYTIAFVSTGYAWLAATYPALGFNPARDLIPVAQLCSQPYTAIARKDAPFKTVREFIAYAKANPGKANFASAGSGTLTHLLPAWLAAEAGISMNHIPYSGTAPAMNSVIAGQTDIYFDPVSTSKVQIKAGTVMGLATTGTVRSPALADLPTLAESGLQTRGSVWYGFMVPAGTPGAVVARLNQEVNGVLGESEIKQTMAGMDFTIETGDVASFGSFLEQQTAVWTKVIKDNNIKAN